MPLIMDSEPGGIACLKDARNSERPAKGEQTLHTTVIGFGSILPCQGIGGCIEYRMVQEDA